MESRDRQHGRTHQRNINLPYWIAWSDQSAQLIGPQQAQRFLHQANPSSGLPRRNRNRNTSVDVPVVHDESDLFRGGIFAVGSLGASLQSSGALKFIADKHEQGKLYDLRNHDVPMGLVLPPSTHRKFTELFHDILQLTDASLRSDLKAGLISPL